MFYGSYRTILFLLFLNEFSLSQCHISFNQYLASYEVITQYRRLSYETIAGYEPATQVTDHAAIDLDMDIIVQALDYKTNDAFRDADAIYKHGGHSKSYAELTLARPTTGFIAKGTPLRGANGHGKSIIGLALDDVHRGSKIIHFQYATSDNQNNYVGCRVGSLPEGNRLLIGCLQEEGSIQINNSGVNLKYFYDSSQKNLNKRTIQGFSINAEEKMMNCDDGCPYKDFQVYANYYGRADYADHWISSSLNGSLTNFDRGNANFGTSTWITRSECAKKGMVYMNVAMYVIREMEDALYNCASTCNSYDCSDKHIHSWDKAVAFFTGSLQGPKAVPGDGIMFYALADERCAIFNTCGSNANENSGESSVNLQIFQEFVLGQFHLRNRKCDAAIMNKERIVNLMSVPLIQSVLRYAYKIGKIHTNPDIDLETNTENAEGAVFVASIIPKIHACNPADAEIIYNNMYLGSSSVNFLEVKKSFEKNYNCLGITCTDVGGLFMGNDYYLDAEPCTSVLISTSFLKKYGSSLIISVLAFIITAIFFFSIFVMRKRAKKVPPIFKPTTYFD